VIDLVPIIENQGVNMRDYCHIEPISRY